MAGRAFGGWRAREGIDAKKPVSRCRAGACRCPAVAAAAGGSPGAAGAARCGAQAGNVRASWHRPRRRLRVAAVREARGGAAAPGSAGGADPRASGGGEPLCPRHAGPQPSARAPAGGGNARSRQPTRRGGAGAVGPVGVLHALRGRLAAQAALPAAAARAGPSRSCSTRTCWRPAGAPSRWRRRPSARTTSSLPTRSTRMARSATRSRSATWRPGTTSPIRSPRCAAAPCGRRTANGCSMWAAIPTKWGQKVFRHRLGTPDGDDELVHEEMAEGFSASLAAHAFRSLPGDRDRRLLHRRRAAGRSRRSDRAGRGPITERKPGHKHVVTDLGDRLIFLTNADGAIDWKIGEKPMSAPADAPLREIVPHVAGRVIEDFIVFREHLVWLERDRERGRQRIRVRRWSDGAEHSHRLRRGAGQGRDRRRGWSRTRARCATPINPWRSPSRCSTTTWRRASARCARCRMCRAATIPPATSRAASLAPAQDGARRARHRPLSQEHQARRLGAGLAVRLRRLRRHREPGVRHRAAVAGGPRLHLCHRPRARRRREGRRVARRRPARQQDHHVHRLHRRRRASRQQRLHAARPHRRLGRLGRRHAGGRGRQHAPGPVRRHLCRGAVRRHPEHAARPLAAAHRVRASPSSATRSTTRRTSSTSAAMRPTRTCAPRPIRRC